MPNTADMDESKKTQQIQTTSMDDANVRCKHRGTRKLFSTHSAV